MIPLIWLLVYLSKLRVWPDENLGKISKNLLRSNIKEISFEWFEAKVGEEREENVPVAHF
ncbi:MAG: hypothetical protein LBL67_03360 [Coriobacteriales bacterium]|jgi:hypothetical protein|nr:hypothetical protein [Coriobacteriales bacterium]